MARSNGTVSFEGCLFEVPYEWVGQKIKLIVDPHQDKVLWGEPIDGGETFAVTLLDKKANAKRKRAPIKPTPPSTKPKRHMADVVLERYQKQLTVKEVTS